MDTWRRRDARDHARGRDDLAPRRSAGVATGAARARGRPGCFAVGGVRFSRLQAILMLVWWLVACVLVISGVLIGQSGAEAGLRDDEWGSELEEMARARRVSREHGREAHVSGGRGHRADGGGGGHGADGGGGAVVGHLHEGKDGGGDGSRGERQTHDTTEYDDPESSGHLIKIKSWNPAFFWTWGGSRGKSWQTKDNNQGGNYGVNPES